MFEISYFHKLWGINPHLFDQRRYGETTATVALFCDSVDRLLDFELSAASVSVCAISYFIL